MSARLTALLFFGLCALPTQTQAHHVVSSSGIAWAEPVSVLEVQLESATFDFGDQGRGQWQSLSLRGEWALTSWVSVSARMPWSVIRFEDGRASTGVGDTELASRFKLYTSDHGELLVSAGMGLELPTGQGRAGLSGGHVEVTPFLIASRQWSPHLITTALISWRQALDTGDADTDTVAARTAHGSVTSPHSEQELSTRLDLAWVQEGSWYVSAGAESHLMIEATSRSPVLLRHEWGLLPAQGLRIALQGDATVHGEARHGLRLGLGLAAIF